MRENYLYILHKYLNIDLLNCLARNENVSNKWLKFKTYYSLRQIHVQKVNDIIHF